MGKGGLSFLNKKSWHTGKLSNHERVWEAEQKEKEEKRKMEERKKEVEEERDTERLRRLQVKAGLIPDKRQRMSWMDRGPDSAAHKEEQHEEYLLGKEYNPDQESKTETGNEHITTEASEWIRKNEARDADALARQRHDPLFKMMQEEKRLRDEAVANAQRRHRISQRESQSRDSSSRYRSRSRKSSSHQRRHRSSDRDRGSYQRLDRRRERDSYRDQGRYRDSDEDRCRQTHRERQRDHDRDGYRYRSRDDRDSFRHERRQGGSRRDGRRDSRDAVDGAIHPSREEQLAAMMENANKVEAERRSEVKNYVQPVRREEKGSRGSGSFLDDVKSQVYRNDALLEERMQRNRHFFGSNDVE